MLSHLDDAYVDNRGRVVCKRGSQDVPATDPDCTMLRKCFLRSLDHLYCNYPDCSVIRKSYLRLVGNCERNFHGSQRTGYVCKSGQCVYVMCNVGGSVFLWGVRRETPLTNNRSGLFFVYAEQRI